MSGGNPHPTNGTANLIHNGRPKGALVKYTRALKTAILLAAEESKHSKTGDVVGYCRYLADEKPELFSPMLTRVLMLQAKVTARVLNINSYNLSTPLPEMMRMFETRIQSASYEPIIEHEHEDPEDEEDPDNQ